MERGEEGKKRKRLQKKKLKPKQRVPSEAVFLPLPHFAEFSAEIEKPVMSQALSPPGDHS